MAKTDKPTIIGRVEKVYLMDYRRMGIPAKVDTGADVSAIWASKIQVKGDELQFRLFGPSSNYYTGKVLKLQKSEYTVTRVSNSFGHKETRYVVKMKIKLAGRVIHTTFTLSNRSKKTYPILLGRKLLHGKFIVDVKQGEPLSLAEKARRLKLQLELKNNGVKLEK